MITKHLLPPRLRVWLRQQLRGAGYDVVHFPRLQLLAHHGVNVLFDVGASEGFYGEEMRRLGFAGRIVSFEPRSAAYARLARRSAGDAGWEALPLALGREPGAAVIHLSGSADSSSLLGMLPRHYETYPETGYVGEEDVDVRRLDDLFETYCRPGDVPFLKMDVQGYEQRVLEGATQVLGRIVGLQMELSLVPLYDGETLFADMIRHLDTLGFTLTALEQGVRDPASQQLLQVDALFFRADAPASSTRPAAAGAPVL